MNDEFDYKFDLLKLEINTVQGIIKSYDTILFTIRGWSITLYSAAVLFTVQTRQPLYLFFCAAIAVLFWLVDASFGAIQDTFIRRYKVIERFLKSELFTNAIKTRSMSNFATPDLRSELPVGKSNRLRMIFKKAINPYTSIAYIVMLILTMVIAIVFAFA